MSSKNKKIYQQVSFCVYIAIILVSSILLFVEPIWFNAKSAILPVVVLLALSSFGISVKLTANSSSRIIAVLGTIALTILLTFIGFFAVATVAWFIGLSYANN